MKPLTHITCFVLEQIESQPLSRRAALYRDLALISGTSALAGRYNQLAANCEALINAHDQLVLDFRRSSNGGPKP